jgi:hypothetical protein
VSKGHTLYTNSEAGKSKYKTKENHKVSGLHISALHRDGVRRFRSRCKSGQWVMGTRQKYNHRKQMDRWGGIDAAGIVTWHGLALMIVGSACSCLI